MYRLISFFSLVGAVAIAAAPIARAQTTKPDANPKSPTPAAAAPASNPTPANSPKQDSATKGAKPKPSPGWVVLDEDWWLPFRYDFADALHNARVYVRSEQEDAAAAEIDKAISWLSYAQSHGNKVTQEDLDTAKSDLMDIAAKLRNGQPLRAVQLDYAFADASAAMAKHHRYLADKALSENDVKAAGWHLMAAVDHLRDASSWANYQYGKAITEIYNKHAPNGHWNESTPTGQNAVDANMELESNLKTVQQELQSLANKMLKDR